MIGKARLTGALVAVVAGAVLVGGLLFALRAQAGVGPDNSVGPLTKAQITGSTQTAQGRLVTASLDLATYPDSKAGEHGPGGGPHPDWVSYGPSTNLWVPAHALVTVTIRQYDTPTTLLNPYFSAVRGTVGDRAYVDGQPLRKLAADGAGHTFTIHSIPTTGQPPLFVSVPLPGVPPSAPALANGYPTPKVVTFSFVTGSSGRYVWQCFVPCGSGETFGGAMSTQGYMAGTLLVGEG